MTKIGNQTPRHSRQESITGIYRIIFQRQWKKRNLYWWKRQGKIY